MNQSHDDRNVKTREAEEAAGREMRTQEKQELRTGGEQMTSGRFYLPRTDICETEDALLILMDMPGVTSETIAVTLEDDLLTVEGRIDFANYRDLKPVYTEYNVGHFKRSFSLSSSVNRDNIVARVSDGVLRLELEKTKAAKARRIEVS